MKKLITFIGVVSILASCATDYGHRVSGGNLTVYFENKKDANLAEKVARYFKDNDLITNEKQDIQLVRKGEIYLLKLIARETKEVKNMPAQERYELSRLQKDLKMTVFEGKVVQLVLCNDKFEPIYNINS